MPAPTDARILIRSEHNISRRDIDPDALKVLYRLHRNGYLAYLVGGSVRDLLLGRAPKDYDIGTDARPEAILDLFRNSRIIGRRFPIVHVMFGSNEVVEVATFRSGSIEEESNLLPTDQDTLEEEERLEAEIDQLMADDENHRNGNDARTAAPPGAKRSARAKAEPAEKTCVPS